MAFSIVAHLRRGPMTWDPYASRDEAGRSIYFYRGDIEPVPGRREAR